MDMNLVRTFVTVYQQNSFTRAADLLNISQPAVSMSIRRLESELGVTLFVKEGRGIAPTAKAVELAEKMQQGIQIIDSALKGNRQHTVCCVEGVSHLVPQRDDIIYKTPPFEQHVIFEQLRSQQIDLALDTTTRKDSAFAIVPIRKEEIVVIARKGHPRISANFLTSDGFFAENHIVYRATREGRRFLDLFALEPLKPRQERVEVYNQASMVLNVCDSDSIGVVFKSIAQKWAEILELNVFETPFACSPVPIQMIYHKRMENDDAHKRLRELIRAEMSDKA